MSLSGWVKIAGVFFLAGFAISMVAPPDGFSLSASSCASREYHQFDFWVGDWDVFENDGTTKVARVRVDRTLNGCVLPEQYEGAGGLQGESLSTYDAGRKLWHQTWVTNRGQLLTIEGQLEGVEMVLSGAYRNLHGGETRVRGICKPVSDGVREIVVTSIDAGRTWKPWFDLWFRPRPAFDAISTKRDEDGVAALDRQFQAAVKGNDFATIDKILADDFILVTGSGEVFHKSELLQEARSRSAVYEHQEDTERTVRVWGDTAVVTAKLWIKGSREGKAIDYTLWFSDTYVRTSSGWRYVFGQASLPLSKN